MGRRPTNRRNRKTGRISGRKLRHLPKNANKGQKQDDEGALGKGHVSKVDSPYKIEGEVAQIQPPGGQGKEKKGRSSRGRGGPYTPQKNWGAPKGGRSWVLRGHALERMYYLMPNKQDAR